MGPDELNDLQEREGAESKKRSALALYDGVREEDLVDEEIDERILGLLGLEDVFDIDYGTYVTLLKERLAASRAFEKKLSTEEDELLVEEFRRVKRKVGRFKLKKRKVSSEDIGVTGPIKVSSNKFLLAGKAVIPEPEESKESSDDIKGIEKSLDAILKTLTLQNKEKKKQSDDERKKSEDRRRRQREGDLEKPLSQLKSLAKKIIAPAQGILDRIFRFIKFTLLGYAFNQLVKWFSDPKNADKVKVLGRFLKDWWPSLLFAYGLFATPFGKFIRVTLKMLRGFIPQIVRFMAAHPLVFAGVTAALATGAAYQWKQQEDKKQIEREAKSRNVKPEVVQKEVTEARSSPIGMIGEAFSKIGPLGAFTGGGTIPIKKSSILSGSGVQKVIDINDLLLGPTGEVTEESGVKIKGAGRDTQLVAARPGEIMVTKEAVQEKGANFFLDLNRKAGGTNIPRMVNNVQLAAGGGIIKKTIKAFQGGGMIGGNKVSTSSSGGSGFNPMSGFKNWWNRGRNVRVPNENTAKFGGLKQYVTKNPNPKTLLGDDALQITRSNKAFQSGATGYSGWNPFKAFTPNMVKTGPTPAIRQAIERPLRSFSSAPKFLKGIGGGVGSVLMDMAFPEPAFNPTLDDAKRMGFPMGPQSRAMPPGPPVITSKTTYTILPPIKAPTKAPSISRGSTLPEFIISSKNDSRSKIASTLGIADLVGAE